MARPLPEPRSYAALPSRLELRPRLRRSIKLSLLLLYFLLVAAVGAIFPEPSPWARILAPAVPLGLLLLGFVTWLLAGRLVLDREVVTLLTPFSRHRIEWSEIESVRVDSWERAIAFAGGGKRLLAPGPEWWGPDDGGYGLFWIEAVANEHGVELERNARWTPYLWCRGTRRWRWSGERDARETGRERYARQRRGARG